MYDPIFLCLNYRSEWRTNLKLSQSYLSPCSFCAYFECVQCRCYPYPLPLPRIKERKYCTHPIPYHTILPTMKKRLINIFRKYRELRRDENFKRSRDFGTHFGWSLCLQPIVMALSLNPAVLIKIIAFYVI